MPPRSRTKPRRASRAKPEPGRLRWAALLRSAIAADPRTTYAIGRRAGVPVQTVDRIVAGQEPHLATAEKLGAVLGLQLVASSSRRSKRAD